MNGLDALFKALESHEFSALLNVASNFKTVARILGSEKTVQELVERMREASVREAVYERLLSLAKDQGAEDYEHPWDSALTTYLWLLANKDRCLATVAATTIAETP